MTDACDIKRRYDADMESKVNGMLAQIFGQGTAFAMIDSTWTYDTTESLTETYDPSNKVTNTDYSRTERSTNADGKVGGPVGTASNIETNANRNTAAVGGTSNDSVDEKRTSTQVGSTLLYTQSSTPELQHLSVALVVDVAAHADAAHADVLILGPWAHGLDVATATVAHGLAEAQVELQQTLELRVLELALQIGRAHV